MARVPHHELAARIAELEAHPGDVSLTPGTRRVSPAVPRRGAELDAGGDGRFAGSSEARSQSELDALRDARAGRTASNGSSGSSALGGADDPEESVARPLSGALESGAPESGGAAAESPATRRGRLDHGAVDGRVDETLPVRNVDDDRGPALVDLEGQLAHDEALGVGPDGRELVAEPARRPKRPKQAALAFTDVLPHQRALDLAYKLVSRREHTARQVRDKLAAKECEVAAIDAAVTELEGYGFVDDRRFARLFAEDKRRLQGWGARRIRLQLARDGIARELLDELFADDEAALDAPSELDAALELLRRKAPDLSDPKIKARTAAMLARRGIASTTVYAALRQHERDTND